MSRRLRRAGGLLITLALVLLIMPARADAPARALHVVYVPAGDAQPDPALRAWLERRGIPYRVAWLGLAVEISEAEAEALGERDDVLLLRTPFPSEPLPGPRRGADHGARVAAGGGAVATTNCKGTPRTPGLDLAT